MWGRVREAVNKSGMSDSEFSAKVGTAALPKLLNRFCDIFGPNRRNITERNGIAVAIHPSPPCVATHVPCYCQLQEHVPFQFVAFGVSRYLSIEPTDSGTGPLGDKIPRILINLWAPRPRPRRWRRWRARTLSLWNRSMIFPRFGGEIS